MWQIRDRPALADLVAVTDLVTATGFFRPSEVAIARELVAEALAHGPAVSGYHFLLADTGDSLAGYACFGPIDGTSGSFDLYWIAVHPSRQGRGLGRLLMGRSEAAILAQGGQRIWVETSTTALYAPTRAFYAACGYAPEAVLDDYYAPGDGKAIYRKVIA